MLSIILLEWKWMRLFCFFNREIKSGLISFNDKWKPFGKMAESGNALASNRVLTPITVCDRPPDEGRTVVGKTARFQPYSWLKVGSGNVALSRPAHQYPEGA